MTAEDWDIINSMVLPSTWYPAETMGRIARGLYELHCNQSYDFIRQFGRTQAPVYLGHVLHFLKKDHIASAIKAFINIADRFVDEISVNLAGSGEAHIEVSFYPVDEAPSFDCYREVMAGYLEWIFDENGGKNPAADFESRLREGQEECIIRVSWQTGSGEGSL